MCLAKYKRMCAFTKCELCFCSPFASVHWVGGKWANVKGNSWRMTKKQVRYWRIFVTCERQWEWVYSYGKCMACIRPNTFAFVWPNIRYMYSQLYKIMILILLMWQVVYQQCHMLLTKTSTITFHIPPPQPHKEHPWWNHKPLSPRNEVVSSVTPGHFSSLAGGFLLQLYKIKHFSRVCKTEKSQWIIIQKCTYLSKMPKFR